MEQDRESKNKPTHLCQVIFFLCFLGPYSLHMEVPGWRLNQSYSCQPKPQPLQREIQVVSVTYTTAHSNARSLTLWAGPGIEPISSWILVRFLTCWATIRITPFFFSFLSILFSFLFLSFPFLSFLLFLAEPMAGIEPTAEQQPEPQKWPWQILNLLNQHTSCPFSFCSGHKGSSHFWSLSFRNYDLFTSRSLNSAWHLMGTQ